MNRLRELREDSDMTQTDVAKAVGVSMMTISHYEREERALTPEMIQRFCRLFGCTADYLLGFSRQRTAAVSESDTELLAAYAAAPAPIRTAVDGLLDPYKATKNQGAGIEAS